MKKGWAIKRLGDLSEVITKGTTPTSIGHKFVPEGINFVKVESIGLNGNFINEKFAHITSAGNNALKRSQLKKNDILFSIAGALGRTAIVNEKILPANTNQALAIIRLKNNPEVLIDYILLSLSSGFIFEQIEKFKGGVAQQNLSLTQIRNFQLPIPPIPEQKRIVAILDEAFAAIDKAKANAEKNLANAKELFDSYLNKIFSNPGEDWEEKKLGELFDVKSSKRVHKKDWRNRGIPFYRAREVVKLAEFGKVDNDLFIDPELYREFTKDKGYPKENDIIISAVGTLGKCYLVKKVDKFYIKDASVLWFDKISDVDSRYIDYSFKSDFILRQVMYKSMGATVGTLTITRAKNIQIPIPILIKQKQIVEKLDKLSTETQKIADIYQQKLKDLEELKKSILKKAFEGKL